jgi:hypothetical protein
MKREPRMAPQRPSRTARAKARASRSRERAQEDQCLDPTNLLREEDLGIEMHMRLRIRNVEKLESINLIARPLHAQHRPLACHLPSRHLISPCLAPAPSPARRRMR